METPIGQAVNAAFEWAQKNSKTFDGQKVGMKLREMIPPEVQSGPNMLDKPEAQKRGVAAAEAVLAN
jgi:hypothetical protein